MDLSKSLRKKFGAELASFKLRRVFAGRVENSKDNHRAAFDAEEDLVRETLYDDAAKVLMIDWILFRRLFQTGQGIRNGGEELLSQSRSLSFVPPPRVGEICLGNGPK